MAAPTSPRRPSRSHTKEVRLRCPGRSSLAGTPRPGRRAFGLATAALLGIVAAPLAAQTGVTLSGAVVPYDLSGTGVSASGALRVDVPVRRMLFVQAGAAYFNYETQADERVGLLIPEVGVVVRPSTLPLYVAGGLGYAVGVRGNAGDDPTLWAAVGLQYGVADGWTVRPEARIRVVDPWVGSMVELSVGLQRWLSPA
ncbi:MAG: hypothetical protein R3E98_03860 [Gemmatimonadota bacterium]